MLLKKCDFKNFIIIFFLMVNILSTYMHSLEKFFIIIKYIKCHHLRNENQNLLKKLKSAKDKVSKVSKLYSKIHCAKNKGWNI